MESLYPVDVMEGLQCIAPDWLQAFANILIYWDFVVCKHKNFIIRQVCINKV